jgi:mRNA interferase MazF
MANLSKNDVILVRYPFTDLSTIKIRPAVVVDSPHTSQDQIVVPLTSQISNLLDGEFLLSDWTGAGLNVPTAVKRGLYTVHPLLIIKRLGRLSQQDAQEIDRSLKSWLGI